MKRMAVGIIFIAGELVWAILVRSGPSVIGQLVLALLGLFLFGLGAHHWWIARR